MGIWDDARKLDILTIQNGGKKNGIPTLIINQNSVMTVIRGKKKISSFSPDNLSTELLKKTSFFITIFLDCVLKNY